MLTNMCSVWAVLFLSSKRTEQLHLVGRGPVQLQPLRKDEGIMDGSEYMWLNQGNMPDYLCIGHLPGFSQVLDVDCLYFKLVVGFR